MLLLVTTLFSGCSTGENSSNSNSTLTVMLDTTNGNVADGATNVSRTPSVVLKFSEAMDVTTINTNTIKFNPTASLKIVALADSKEFSITTDSPLQGKTKYTINVLGVKSQSGKTLSASFSFTTGDFTFPTVVILAPPNGATGVSKTPISNSRLILKCSKIRV